MSLIKTKDDLNKMRKGAHLLFTVLQNAENKIKPGMTTLALDKIIEDNILKLNCKPAFKGYSGFPNSACISINEEVVHGIPNKHRVIKNSDVLKLDLGLIYKGVYTDMARTYLVRDKNEKKQALIQTTKESCELGGSLARDGMRLGTLGFEIQQYAEEKGYGIVRDYVGHGIGHNLHEDPQVPNYGYPDTGFTLKKNMVICIEPMVNQGTFKVHTLKNQWTVVTNDKKLSAHWENMYLVGATKGERLTI